jgi:hypothetical protein
MRLQQSTPWPAFAGGPEPERTKIESRCSQMWSMFYSVLPALTLTADPS